MHTALKKTVALLLVVIMLSGLSVTAFAKSTEWISQSLSDIPVIRISGDGEKLVDEDGNKVIHYKDLPSVLTSGDDDEDDDDSTMRSIANVLMPFLVNGLLLNDWDPYYENLQKEVGELFERSLLDKDGNPQYGTGLSADKIEKMDRIRHNDQSWRKDGVKYYVNDRYWFNYDWRLDPLATAAEFKSFIDDVMASTGCSQVGIVASCLGTNVVTAYLALYPEHAAQHVRGVAFDGSVVGGAEMMSETISGKFNVDAAAINRALIDCGAIGMFSVDEFVNITLEMLDKTGLLDSMLDMPKKLIYYRIVKGATSALALSTFYTWPNYWACVTAEDYATALEYVFGPEGSEKRAEYAGLIEKLDHYDELVRQRVREVLTVAVENGTHFGVISKYGFQILPICETNYVISDQFASVKRSSFGATTGTIYADLSDKYIATRTAAGYGDYISPDGQIDASTCLFPESTWFIKGSSHSNWSDWENRMLYEIASAKEQLTVETGCWPSRFVVYSYTNPDDAKDGEIEAMTPENCDTENWVAEDKAETAKNPFKRLFEGIAAWFRWIKALFQFMSRSAAN
jgi:pimeloyl-ACP methyl ester carboxylesterase